MFVLFLASDELNEAVDQVERLTNHGNKLEEILGLNRQERGILSEDRQKRHGPRGSRPKRGLTIHRSELGNHSGTRRKRAGPRAPRPK